MPDWPEADFIVGNPPFIGGKDLRDRLGSDYAEALGTPTPRVPKSADFVMQWWDRAAHTLTRRTARSVRFGFVTTNSITQEFSRRVIAGYLAPSPPKERVDSPKASGVRGVARPSPLAPRPLWGRQVGGRRRRPPNRLKPSKPARSLNLLRRRRGAPAPNPPHKGEGSPSSWPSPITRGPRRPKTPPPCASP